MKASLLSIQLLLIASIAGAAPTELRTGTNAFGDFSSDAPGVRRQITAQDLPKAYDTKSVDNGAKIVARPADAWPKAPAGFEVDLLADGLDNPRKIITAPNGDLFVAESGANRVKVLRQGADGKLISTNVFAEKLRQPFGLAFYPPGKHPEYIYIGNTDSVVRYKYKNGDLVAASAEEMIVPDIPGGGRLRGGGHWTRDIVFSPDGKKMFVSVGSHSNVNDDKDEYHRADILEFDPRGELDNPSSYIYGDASGMGKPIPYTNETPCTIFASGIRNPVGLAIAPDGALWTSVNERDGLGNNVPPDYITHVEKNGFYGWPWYYIGNNQDPRHAGEHPELAGKAIIPDVLLQPHSASLCLTFYTGKQFPKEFRGNIFAAEHGSWNRDRRTGYKVIVVPIKNGKALGEYDDFLTGFVTPTGDVWGRPVGVTVDSHGSLIVVDDGSKSVWRVRYTGKK